MSGDLEDFLRRAAQRRQAKTSQQQQRQSTQSKPTQRTKPQYSDSRTERTVRPPVEDSNDAAGQIAAELESVATQRERIADIQRAVASATAAKGKAPARSTPRVSYESHTLTAKRAEVDRGATGPSPVQDIIKLLRRPGGIQQAVLLREILDRPVHRW